MRTASAEQRFEEAARYRDQWQALKALRDKGNLDSLAQSAAPSVHPDKAVPSLARALHMSVPPNIIEGFDIAHLMGSDVVASMVQFVDGQPNNDGYRRFKIDAAADGGETNDDFAAMHQVVLRRYRRQREGAPMPDLIVIDGGLGQVHAAEEALGNWLVGFRLVSLVSPKKKKLSCFLMVKSLRMSRRNSGHKLLTFVRDEAHRFSRRYHHWLRERRFDQPKPRKKRATSHKSKSKQASYNIASQSRTIASIPLLLVWGRICQRKMVKNLNLTWENGWYPG